MRNLKSSKSEYFYDSRLKELRIFDEFVNLINFTDLILQLTRRDIVSRYKRSTLGILWTMLNPLGMMIILTTVFSGLFNRVGGYPVYVLSGIIAWNFFSQTTTTALHQMVWGAALLRKIYLPRSTFIVSTVLTGLVNLLLSLLPIALVMLYSGIPFHLALLFLPFAIFCLSLFSLGLGLILSTIAVYFSDVADMYQMVLLAWLYITPIFYPKEILIEANRQWLFEFNPMYYLIEFFRAPIYEGRLPDLANIFIGVGVACTTALFGWAVFTRQSDDFVYHI